MRLRAPFLLFVLVTGCALEVGTSEEELSGGGFTTRSPSPPELPPCWWSEDPDDCLERCETETRDPEVRRRVVQLRALRRRGGERLFPRTTLAADPSARSAAAALDLDFTVPPDDGCGTPNGVVACPHCRRPPTSPATGQFYVHDSGLSWTGSRVFITNGYGASRIVDMPALEPGGPIEISPVGLPTQLVNVNLAGGVVLDQKGSINFGGTLYILFTIESLTNVQPAMFWTECRADGTLCEPMDG
jgi:hypothetical protein